jgi:XTP/dITP diphosphohydrolase
MKSILVVTTNEDKFKEISMVLKEFGIKTKKVSVELHEYGGTVEEVAMNKARGAYKKLKKPLIVDDTGIFFSAYKDFPGILAKRFYLSLGYDGLMKLLENKTRKAYYHAVICYCDGRILKTFSGKLHGTIVRKIHADKFQRQKFPYDRIFIENTYKKPVSLLKWKEKIKISHRSKAVRKFARWFKD